MSLLREDEGAYFGNLTAVLRSWFVSLTMSAKGRGALADLALAAPRQILREVMGHRLQRTCPAG